MASPRFQVALAVEIPTYRQTQDSQRSASTYPDYSARQSDLGSSPHRSGTSLEIGNPSVSPHRSEISAGGSQGWSTPGGSPSALDDLRSQSCPGHAGL